MDVYGWEIYEIRYVYREEEEEQEQGAHEEMEIKGP